MLVLVGAGCEEAGQRGARQALQAYLRAHQAGGRYTIPSAHCTRAGRYFVLQSVRTKRYYCTARIEKSGDCDLFRVDARPDRSAAVLVVKRDGGCVLPAG